MCGVLGISGHTEASRLTYFGLYALQHRGQECAGITTFDGKNQHLYVGAGLVHDVFQEEDLQNLAGNYAIGHIRYGSSENRGVRSALPIAVRMSKGLQLAIAHDGRLLNACELRKELEDEGAIFQSNSDTEIFVHLISHRLRSMSLEEAILDACRQIQGSYSIVILANDKLIALRDPHGFHPLLLGKISDENSYVFASESCAFDLLEAEYVRDVLPGEMLVIERENNLKSYRFGEGTPVKQCIFELVYFARPDSVIFGGESVYQCRKKMGQTMVREAREEVDCVIPFPDSGIYATLGAAQEANAPYEHALIRNHYVGRTFIQPTQSMREFGVRVKINPVKSMIKDKKLMVCDDSIVRGTTVRTRVSKLRRLGAKEVHFRVSSPPVKFPCFYGVDFPSPKELIATSLTPEQIRLELGLDSLHYLTIDGLMSTVACPTCYCTACFTGEYPIQANDCDCCDS